MTSGLSLEAQHLTVAYGPKPVLADLSLTLPMGKVSVILGPNGCGKSTLLKTLGRIITPSSGKVLLGGSDISTLPSRSVARQLALLPQAPLAPDGITVADLVARARAPWRGLFSGWTEADQRLCDTAIAACGLSDLAEAQVAELSGGQRQRVWIALTLAQDTPLMLLDEPTTWLDLPHQIDLLALLRQMNREQGRTVIMVLHDLNLSARFADHLVLMRQGRILAEGAPEAVLTPATLEAGFGLKAMTLPDPVSGTPMVVPL